MKKQIASVMTLALCAPLLMGMSGCTSSGNSFNTAAKSESSSANQTESSTVPEVIPDNPDAAAVRVNQVGYMPNMPKIAVVVDGGRTFTVKKTDTDEIVYSGVIRKGSFDFVSGDNVNYADFSAVTERGKYYLEVDESIRSYNFDIADNVYVGVKNAMIKALYYNRCGCGLEEKYAGVFKHDKCHTEKAVLYSDKSVNLDVSGGWHDAGDYGRYSITAATTLGHLLNAYELFPESFEDELNIPESGNGVPDLLNECRYELEWLLKMQNKETGGVYHKSATLQFAWGKMPEDDKQTVYVFHETTPDTAGFAAVCAMASRIYSEYDKEFSQNLLQASLAAWDWLEENPEHIGYTNTPDDVSGEYGDANSDDERYWAAAELYRTTGDKKFNDAFIELFNNGSADKMGLGWYENSGFGSLAYLFTTEYPTDEQTITKLKARFKAEADKLYTRSLSDGYQLGMNLTDYVWGSNMVIMNNTIRLIVANMLESNSEYDKVISENFNYLLGKNATGYSYVTGFGENAFRNPHLGTTFADNVDEPVPGWVAGGPNSTWDCSPYDASIKLLPSDTPYAKAYVDDVGSWTTNEVDICWNSPAVFVAAYLCR